MKKIIPLFIFVMLLGSMGLTQENGQFSADDWYNQGNTAFNNEQYGDAVYFYEKSLILEPNAKDALINLELSKERLDADIVELDSFFLAKWWNGVYNLFTPGTWKILSILFLVAIILLLYFFLFKNEKVKKNLAFGGFAAFGVLLLLSILAGNSRSNSIFNNPYAVISGDAESLYLAPDEVSEKIKDVTSGVKVKVLDSNTEWYKVATMDSEQGWIKKEDVRALRF